MKSDEIEELRNRLERQEVELSRARAETARLRVVLYHAYQCLPDMPAVCCQTVRQFMEVEA